MHHTRKSKGNSEERCRGLTHYFPHSLKRVFKADARRRDAEFARGKSEPGETLLLRDGLAVEVTE